VSTGLNETDNRIFILDRVQLAVSAPIVVVTVSNDTLVLILETFQILRIDLQKEDQIECMCQSDDHS
jgi:flagellar biogenesis protein FliO